jgi:hypothetical protein
MNCSTRRVWSPRPGATPGRPRPTQPMPLRIMSSDHRRILATGAGPPAQQAEIPTGPVRPDALASSPCPNSRRPPKPSRASALHKQNFRRGVERTGLVEPTGQTVFHHGRPTRRTVSIQGRRSLRPAPRRACLCPRKDSVGFLSQTACEAAAAATREAPRSTKRYRRRGEVAEWSNVPHSKCGVPGRVPWVRIPPSPPSSWRPRNRGCAGQRPDQNLASSIVVAGSWRPEAHEPGRRLAIGGGPCHVSGY